MSKKYTTNFLQDTNGSTGSANQVLISTSSGVDWVDGSGSSIIGGPYLPLAGGTMTGNTIHNDNVKSIYGTGSDLEIYHDATNSFITNTGGSLIVRATNFAVQSSDGTDDFITTVQNAQVNLFYNGSKKFETSNTGITITGNLDGAANMFLQDYIYHSGDGNTFFGFSGNDTIRITTNNTPKIAITASEVFLSYEGSDRLQTTNAGVVVTGKISGLTAGTANTDAVNLQQLNDATTGALIFVGTWSAAPTTTSVLNGAVSSSATIVIAAANAGISTGATVTGTGISGTVTVSSVNADGVTITISSSQTIADGATLTFTTVGGTPDLSQTSRKVTGHYYICETAGVATPNGASTTPNEWAVGDWVAFSDLATDAWQKIDNSSVLSGAGTGGSLAAWSGSGTSVTLQDAPATFSGSSTTFAGDVKLDNILLVPAVLPAVNTPSINLRNTNNEVYFQAGSANVFNFIKADYTTMLTLDASGNAIFAGDVYVNGGDLSVGSSGTVNSVINMLGTNDSFIEKDTGNHLFIANNASDKDIKFRVKDDTTNIVVLTLDGSEGGNAAFAGNISAPQIALTTSSTTEPALRLIDAGVIAYDWTFPDTGTLKLGVSSTSTKTLSLLNAGTGKFNLSVDGNVKIFGTDTAALQFENAVNGTRFHYLIPHYSASDSSLNSLEFKVSSSTPGNEVSVMTLNGAGNVGIAVTPETDWDARYKALQINAGSSLAAYASGTTLATVISTNQRTIGNTFIGNNKYIKTAAASLYLQDDTGGHIWYNAASGTENTTITWAERMRIDSDGNVGIATGSPNEKLQVGGNISIYDEEGNTDANLFISKGSTNVTTVTIASNGVSYFNGGNVGIGTTAPFTNLEVEGSGADSIIRLHAGGGAADISTWEMRAVGVAGEGLLFRQVNDANSVYTNRMIIDTSGNVGIGTITPSKGDYGTVTPKLHVVGPNAAGASNLVARFQAGDDANDSLASILINHGNDRGLLIEGGRGGAGTIPDDDAVSHLGLINSAGALTRMITLRQSNAAAANGYNVGIGTTGPVAKLDVKGVGTANGLTFRTTDSSANEIFYIKDGGTVGVRYYPFKIGVPSGTSNVANSRFQIATTAGDFVVLNDGKTGIGTQTPTERLEVDGNLITLGKTRGLGTNYATSEGWFEAATILSMTGYFGGNFSRNGAAAENKIEYATGPFNTPDLVWMTVPEVISNDDGGWNKGVTGFPNTANNGFMSVVYVRRDAGTPAGTFYHGCSGTTTNNLDGTSNGNPYFCSFSVATLPADVWCVSIGIIYAANDGTTASSPLTGTYRMDTGQKIHTGSTYRQKPSTSTQIQRVYHYYSTSPSAQLDFTRPGWYVIDGSEPTLNEITQGAATDAFWSATGINIHNNNSGNVGIGTTNPTFSNGSGLVINSDAVARLKLTNPTSGQGATDGFEFIHAGVDAYVYNYEAGPMYFGTSNATQMTLTAAGNLEFNGSSLISSNTADGADNAQIVITGGGAAGDTRGASVHMAGNENGNAGLLQLRAGDGSVGGIRLYEGGSERMRITNGSVGINETNPSEKLQVQGNIVVNKDSTAANFVSKTFTTGHATANRGGSILFGMNDSTPTGMRVTTSAQGDNYNKQEIEFITHKGAVSVGTRMFIDAIGNVGIGTVVPARKLHVSLGQTNGDVALFTNDVNADLNINFSGGVTSLLPSTNTLAFGVSSTEGMRITSNRNVLIGKTADDVTTQGVNIQAGGAVSIVRTSGAPLTLRRDSSNVIQIFRRSATLVGRIDVTTNSTSYGTSSDYRLKEDLQDFNGLDIVSKIKMYNFKWKNEDERSYGVVAHELQAEFPQAVAGNKDDVEMQGVDYSKLVPLLVKSVQELTEEIKLLKQQINK